MTVRSFTPLPKRSIPAPPNYEPVCTAAELHGLLDELLARGGHPMVEIHFRGWLSLDSHDLPPEGPKAPVIDLADHVRRGRRSQALQRDDTRAPA